MIAGSFKTESVPSIPLTSKVVILKRTHLSCRLRRLLPPCPSRAEWWLFDLADRPEAIFDGDVVGERGVALRERQVSGIDRDRAKGLDRPLQPAPYPSRRRLIALDQREVGKRK
jgi:hypothetical protein